jgi:hypothetical protein
VGNKFITPMIANGKVYVATTNGVGVFGLLPGHAALAAADEQTFLWHMTTLHQSGPNQGKAAIDFHFKHQTEPSNLHSLTDYFAQHPAPAGALGGLSPHGTSKGSQPGNHFASRLEDGWSWLDIV